MTLLTLSDLTVLRSECPVVDHVSLSIEPGEFVGLIGPNGAGKTTLMRGALGLIPAYGQSSLADLTPEARARTVAFLPQAREIAWPVTVRTLVGLGRTPWRGALARETKADRAAVDRALSHMGLQDFAERDATKLSGGEQARVLIARALAQETPLLMADEPAAGLDPANQIATLRVFAGLSRQGHAVLCSMHDLGQAARHCDRLVLMHRGRIVADGPVRAVLTPENLAQVFEIAAHLSEGTDGLVFQPLEVLA